MSSLSRRGPPPIKSGEGHDDGGQESIIKRVGIKPDQEPSSSRAAASGFAIHFPMGRRGVSPIELPRPIARRGIRHGSDETPVDDGVARLYPPIGVIRLQRDRARPDEFTQAAHIIQYNWRPHRLRVQRRETEPLV